MSNNFEKVGGFMPKKVEGDIVPPEHAVAIDDKTNEVLYNVPVSSQAQKDILKQKAKEAGSIDLEFFPTKKGADDVVDSIKETNQ